MGCNCKTIKQVGERFNANGKQFEKKGALKILSFVGDSLINILNTIILSLIIIISAPIITCILLFNVIFRNKASISLPNVFLNKNKISENSNVEDNKEFINVIEE